MNLLLDTHVFLWFISGDRRLPPGMRESIQNPDNTTYLSVVSLWEAIIKHQLGKLPLPTSPEIYIPEQRVRHQILGLPVDETSVARLASLPLLHRDPFDRILICQALQYNLVIATVDKAIEAYPVKLLQIN